jgi:hypothetical protein
MKRLISFLAVGIAANYVLGGVAACSSDAPPPEKKVAPQVGKRGTLSMALEAVSESGKIYRLRNATFLVNSTFFFPGPFPGSASGSGSGVAFPDAAPPPIGSAGTVAAGGGIGFMDGGFGGFGGSAGGGFVDSGVAGFFPGTGGFFPGAGGSIIFPGSTSVVLSSEDDPNAQVIERFLAPNSYIIDLVDGWFVEQVDNLLGTTAFVPATLRSSPFQFFTITSDQETFVRYDFDVDGSRVSFGPPGRLIIGIGVQETNGQGACGDGIIQPELGEVCDGANVNGVTCASATMGLLPNGPLFCSKDCFFFDTSFCFGNGGGGGTGGVGTGGFAGSFGIDGGQMPKGGASGSVGFPGVDAGTAGSGAGGTPGMPPSP